MSTLTYFNEKLPIVSNDGSFDSSSTTLNIELVESTSDMPDRTLYIRAVTDSGNSIMGIALSPEHAIALQSALTKACMHMNLL